MKFEMNSRNWIIREVEQKKFWEDDNAVQKENDGNFLGRTLFAKQEIWLDRNISNEQKRKTLYHELLHCYKGMYITFNDLPVDEEMLCDISANSHDIIHNIVEKYFDTIKKE